MEFWDEVPNYTGYLANFLGISVKSKFYLNRLDWRTYFVCHESLVHLLGTIISNVLQGPTLAARGALRVSILIPPQGKDTLNIVLTVPKGYHVLSKKSDIGSFTASAANGLFLLLAIEVSLIGRQGIGHLHQTFVIRHEGEFLLVTMKEVILLYLLLVIGRRFNLNGLPYPHVGYLGLPGNNIIAMNAFAHRIEQIEFSLKRRYPDLIIATQLAGDDYWQFMAHPSKDVLQECEAIAAREILLYVGQEKTPRLDWYVAHGDSVHEDGEFCKKVVDLEILEQRNGTIHLRFRTRKTLPLSPACFDFVSDADAEDIRYFHREMRSLHAMLRKDGFERYYPTYYFAARENYGLGYVTDSRTMKKFIVDGELIERIDRQFLLAGAYSLVVHFRPVALSAVSLLALPVGVKLSILSSQKAISQKKVYVNGVDELTVWGTHRDFSQLQAVNRVVQNYLPDRQGGTIVTSIIDSFRRLRSYIREL